VISSDRRKLFINIFSKTTWKLFMNLQEIQVQKPSMHTFGREPTTLGLGGLCYTTVPLIQYDNSAKKIKLLRKWQ
jgi:hypothetical protein